MAGGSNPSGACLVKKIRDSVEMHWFKVEIGSGGTFAYVKQRRVGLEASNTEPHRKNT